MFCASGCVHASFFIRSISTRRKTCVAFMICRIVLGAAQGQESSQGLFQFHSKCSLFDHVILFNALAGGGSEARQGEGKAAREGEEVTYFFNVQINKPN